MKKIILFLLLIPIVGLSQLQLPYQYKNVSATPSSVDYYYYNSSTVPYTNTTQVTSQVISAVRYVGQTFNVNGDEYWFKSGITDGDLVLKLSTSSGTVTSISTTSPITGGPITTTGTIAISNSAADGSTKGAASFDPSDFNSSSGNINIDYTNAQAANSGTKGFLTAADWVTFNSKIGTEVDPVVKAITGIVKSNGTTISAAISGTDFIGPTLISNTDISGAFNFTLGNSTALNSMSIISTNGLFLPTHTYTGNGTTTGLDIALQTITSLSTGTFFVKTTDRTSTTTNAVIVQTGNSTSASSGTIIVTSGTSTTSGNTGSASLRTGNSAGTSGGASIITGSSASQSGSISLGTGASSVNNSGQILIQTGIASTNSGNVNIGTGNATTGSTGNVNISTATATAGTSGSINLNSSNNVLLTTLSGSNFINVTSSDSAIYINPLETLYLISSSGNINIETQNPNNDLSIITRNIDINSSGNITSISNGDNTLSGTGNITVSGGGTAQIAGQVVTLIGNTGSVAQLSIIDNTGVSGAANQVLTADGSGGSLWGPVVDYGTFTPTITGTNNLVTTPTISDMYWSRIGDIVTFSGFISNIQNTLLGYANVRILIPVNSAWGSTFGAGANGTVSSASTSTVSPFISGSVSSGTDDHMDINLYINSTTVTTAIKFSGTYKIF